MTDYYILFDGEPAFTVRAPDEDGVQEVGSAVEKNYEWAVETAKDAMKESGGLTLGQMVRFFGREATYMPMSDYTRRVQKREDGTKREDGEVTLSAQGDIVKTDPDERVVFGWAYVVQDKDGNQVIDKSGDFIDQVEEIEKSAYDYVLRSRASDADHTNVKGGTLVESIVFTPEKIEKMGLATGSVPLGWWVGYKIEDDATWERVKKGELRSFSIHGSGTRTKVDPNV